MCVDEVAEKGFALPVHEEVVGSDPVEVDDGVVGVQCVEYACYGAEVCGVEEDVVV